MTADPSSTFSRFQLRLMAVGAVIAISIFLWVAASAVLVAFIGVLFGVSFSALAAITQKLLPLSYRWSLFISMILLLLLVGAALVFAAPRMANEARTLRREVPAAWEKLQHRMVNTSWGGALLENGAEHGDWMPDARTVTSRLAGVFTTAVGAGAAAVAAMFLGLFLAIEPRMYVDGCVRLFPPARRRRADEIMKKLGRVLRRWLLAKMISMAIVGVFTGVGLTLLGVPLAFILAGLACLLTFIPNIGPVLAAAPAVLLAFVDSPSKAFYVVLLYIGVQAVESYGITPFIERETVALPPAITLTAQLALGLLAGFVGVIVATPLVAVIIVLVQTLYIQDLLGDRGQPSIGDKH